jgi:hypothetical protein
METAGVEPTPPRCKRGALPFELHPQGADGWSRTTTAGAPRLQRGELARCSASARKWGDRPGSNRRRGDHDPGCFRLHHGHHEAGTTGLEPAASRLTSERSARLSYAPGVARVGFEPTVSSS